jgi:hypothetical protein
MQGLIQIEMLKTIEQMTGKSISELFDWVVGTSTGGILALGMIYGMCIRIDLWPSSCVLYYCPRNNDNIHDDICMYMQGVFCLVSTIML